MRKNHTSIQKRPLMKILGFSSCIIVIFFSLMPTSGSSQIQLTKNSQEIHNIVPLNSASILGSLEISNLNPWDNYPHLSNGSGTIEDPYIIENITFDAQYDQFVLLIMNSHAYTIIRNCTFTNSKNRYPGSLLLYNSTNIQITNNSIINNKQTGIFLGESWNISIANNVIRNNSGDGIFSFSSFHINISHNEIFENDGQGIVLEISSYFEIINNYVCCNTNGIRFFYDSSYNNVINNSISHSIFNSIQLESCSYNHIIGNNLSDNQYNKIDIIYDDLTNIIYNNIIDPDPASNDPNTDIPNTDTDPNEIHDYFYREPSTDTSNNPFEINIITVIIAICVTLGITYVAISINLNISIGRKSSRLLKIQPLNENTPSHHLEPDSSESKKNTPNHVLEESKRPIKAGQSQYCPNCGTHIPSSTALLVHTTSIQIFCHLCGSNLR